MSFLKRLLVRGTSRAAGAVFETGFHGDLHLLSLTSWLLPQCSAFVETGANVGTTARYVGRMFPSLHVYSCEPDVEAWNATCKNTVELPNVEVRNATSPKFLQLLYADHPELPRKRNAFWLDAHGYGFVWPLLDEVAFVTREQLSGVLLIDDFRIEGRDEFHFCTYDGQSCDLAYIKSNLDVRHSYMQLTPTYIDHASPHHPLVGVGIILFGFAEVSLPPDLDALFRVDQVEF